MGQPIAGATVEIHHDLGSYDLFEVEPVISDKNGSFTLKFAGGTLRKMKVTAVFGDLRSAPTLPLERGTRLVLLVEDELPVLSGRIVDEDGEPISGIALEATMYATPTSDPYREQRFDLGCRRAL